MPTGARDEARSVREVDVGEVVRFIRLWRGMSVRTLVAETDFSPSFISQVEPGQV